MTMLCYGLVSWGKVKLFRVAVHIPPSDLDFVAFSYVYCIHLTIHRLRTRIFNGSKYFLHTCRKASSLFYIGRRFVERSSLHLEHGRVMRWLLPLSQSGLILSRSRYFIHYTGHCGSRVPPAGIYQPVGLSPCPSSSVYSRR